MKLAPNTELWNRVDERTPVVVTIFLAGMSFVASLMQRVTGLGFIFVSVPFFVIVYGPTHGVLLAMVLGGISSLLILGEMWRSVAWEIVLPLVIMAVVCVPVGAWITGLLSETTLLLVVGATGILALSGMRMRPVERFMSRPIGPYAAGMLSSIMHVSSGVSGPPLVALGHSRRWDQVKFIASMQVVFVCLNALSLVMRGMPSVPHAEILFYTAMVPAGTLVGFIIAAKIPTTIARRIMIAFAFVGTAVVFIKGIIQLLG